MISNEALTILKRMHIKQLIEHKKTTGHIIKMLSDKLQKANIQTKLPALEDLRKYIKDTYSFIEIEVPGGLVGELKWIQASESSEETNGCGINTHEQVKSEESNDKYSIDDESIGDTIELPKNKRGRKLKVDNERDKNDLSVNDNPTGDALSKSTLEDEHCKITNRDTDNKADESKPFKLETITEIAQAVESLNKNIKELKAEIRTLKTMVSSNSSAKKINVSENRQYIEQIMKIYTSATVKREIRVNKEIEKCVKDLIYEMYGALDDDNKVINTALLLALLKGRM